MNRLWYPLVYFVLCNVATCHDLCRSSSSHFSSPLFPPQTPNHWLQKTYELNVWLGKVIADYRRVPSDSSLGRGVSLPVHCAVSKAFIAPLCLPPHRFTPHISLCGFPLQIPGVCHLHILISSPPVATFNCALLHYCLTHCYVVYYLTGFSECAKTCLAQERHSYST